MDNKKGRNLWLSLILWALVAVPSAFFVKWSVGAMGVFLLGVISGFVYIAAVFSIENLVYASRLAGSYKKVNKTKFAQAGGWSTLGIVVGITIERIFSHIIPYSGMYYFFAIGALLSMILTGYFRNKIGLTKH